LVAILETDPAAVTSVTDYLSATGSRRGYLTGPGLPLLHFAAAFGRGLTLSYLLDRGAGVKRSNTFRVTPLHLACQRGQRTAVKLLLERGADPTLVDYSGRTPLLEASAASKSTCLRLLLQDESVRTSVNNRDRQGGTTFLLLCEKVTADKNVGGSVKGEETARMFLEAGADPKLRGKRRYTALVCLEEAKCDALISLLKVS